MKEKIKEFLLLPPVIVLIALVIYGFVGRYIPAPAERISVENFLYYHSAEEIAEYYEDCGELYYIADAIEEASDGEMYCLTAEEVDDLVKWAYDKGYRRAAVGRSRGECYASDFLD